MEDCWAGGEKIAAEIGGSSPSGVADGTSTSWHFASKLQQLRRQRHQTAEDVLGDTEDAGRRHRRRTQCQMRMMYGEVKVIINMI